MTLSRRSFLARTVAAGCSLAASPLLAPVAIASAPWENRLVVVILRGGMDGMGVVQPWGDPDFAALRADSGMRTRGDAGGPLDLTDFYSMHRGLEPLMPLWRAGELGFVNAVSTPYRDKRSHFDGQDLLEAGMVDGDRIRDGWLNRMLQAVPVIEAETAYTIGASGMLLTKGDAPVAEWSPQAVLAMTPQSRKLMEHVMHDDPLFRDVLTEALDLSVSSDAARMMQSGGMDGSPEDMLSGMAAVRQRSQLAKDNAGAKHVAGFAAERLRGDARIAAFSINGWDTHSRQDGALRRPLEQLAQMILTLKEGLGPVWAKTGVIAMTEFGRTARINGTGGTDHGTGGTMVLAGGALRGGQVHGNWPGLSEASLYQRRDLMPTSDVRTHAASVMQGLFGLPTDLLENTVFPGLRMDGASKLVL